jgi:hypothetical protein
MFLARHSRPLALCLILLVGVAAYSNTFNVPFQFDDFGNITENPVMKNLDNFISSRTGYDFNPRRYIGHLTFALNYHFGDLHTTGYHIVNLAIHLANAILVYFLVILTMQVIGNRQWAMGKRQEARDEGGPMANRQSPIASSRLIALFAALLFVSHPIQTQAVTYIVQRLTSLAAFFYLLSVVAYVKGRQGAMGNGQWAKDENGQGAMGNGQWAKDENGQGAMRRRLSPLAYRLSPIASHFGLRFL